MQCSTLRITFYNIPLHISGNEDKNSCRQTEKDAFLKEGGHPGKAVSQGWQPA